MVPQISLDMDTPLEVVEMLRGTVEAHVKANAAEFSGASAGACGGLGGWVVWLRLPGNAMSMARPGVVVVTVGAGPSHPRTGEQATVQSSPRRQPSFLSASAGAPARRRCRRRCVLRLAAAVNVRAMGDPLKLVISVWYEYNHCGVDQGRCSRARWVVSCARPAAASAAEGERCACTDACLLLCLGGCSSLWVGWGGALLLEGGAGLEAAQLKRRCPPCRLVRGLQRADAALPCAYTYAPCCFPWRHKLCLPSLSLWKCVH